MFNRPVYLNKLISLMDNGRVKIITGIRRCGKSFLLKEIFSKYLYDHGIVQNHFIYISLEDIDNMYLYNPLELNKYIKSLIKDNEKYYIVIDEIQNVYNIINPILTNGEIKKAKKCDTDIIGFVNVVLSLMKISNLDLYITGSNSRFLSKDIVTDFRDRGDEIHVLPLSFSEYVEANNVNVEQAYEEYSLYGGMPMLVAYNDNVSKEKYLSNLFNLTYKLDILERNGRTKNTEIDTLANVLASNIGSLISPTIIANTFNSKEKNNMTTNKINSNLNEFEDAYIINRVSRFEIRGRKHIGASYKFYFTDLGLRNVLLNFMHNDSGHVMENIIYNELIYRGYNVEVGTIEAYSKDKNNKTIRVNYETDFIARMGSKVYYIQSAYDLHSEEKYEQETKSLRTITDSFKKIVIKRQSGPIKRDNNGITTMSIIDFLLDKDSLDK